MLGKVYHGLGLLAVTASLAGCGGHPVAKYQPGDANVTAGETTEWDFDHDPACGLPPGAETFSGHWEVRAEEDAPSSPHVLCQKGTAEFPALCLSDKRYADVV